MKETLKIRIVYEPVSIFDYGQSVEINCAPNTTIETAIAMAKSFTETFSKRGKYRAKVKSVTVTRNVINALEIFCDYCGMPLISMTEKCPDCGGGGLG